MLIVAWTLIVPVFIAGQVSFWQGMTQKAHASELQDKKDSAIAVLAAYNSADYRDAEKVILAKAIADGNAAINGVTNAGPVTVTIARNNAIGVIDAIKTDAELTAEEAIAKAKADNRAAADDLQKKLDKAQAAKDKLQQNLGQIQQSVSIVKLDIGKTKSAIQDTVQTIAQKEAEVANMNNQIQLQKELLKNFIQQVYYNQNQPILSIVLSSANFSDIFSSTNHLLTVGDKIKEISDNLNANIAQLEDAKSQLADAKKQNEQVLAAKVGQQQGLVATQVGVQQDIVEKEATIGELQQKLAELQKDLNKVTGKSYTATDVKDAIKFANSVTKVREGFLFGMLSMESGGNPLAGKCTFDNSSMNATRKTYFKDIVAELNSNGKKYDYRKMPVSCASPSYPGTGGAMGAAQFMSDTWAGYKKSIASETGNNPPDPWSLGDGVVAMALKLKNDGATNSGTVKITVPRAPDAKTYNSFPQCSSPNRSVAQKKASVKWELYASMKYLGWSCYAYASYGPGIQSLANGYNKL